MNTQLAEREDGLDLVVTAIRSDPTLADSTKHQYVKAIRNYAAKGHSLTDPKALTEYAATVGSSTRAFLSAAVAKLCAAIEVEAKSQATPENVAAVQATVYRAEALREAVTVEASAGQKAHTWLSRAEVLQLLDTCDQEDVVGQRDRLALGLLVGAGLRRREAVELCYADVKLQPVKEKMRTVLDVRGKGAKDRVVPISDRLANAIDEWTGVVGNGSGRTEGRILRSLGRDRQPGDSLSTTAIYNLVQKRGAMIDKPDLAPHDLRRTFAQLGFEAGVPITQISTLLGHASVETTQRYLNLELDLETTVSDFIPF
jgi:integrase